MNVVITSNHGVCIHAFVWLCLSVNKSWFCSSLSYWMERWVSSRINRPSLHLHMSSLKTILTGKKKSSSCQLKFFLRKQLYFTAFPSSPCPSHICCPSLLAISPVFGKRNNNLSPFKIHTCRRHMHC